MSTPYAFLPGMDVVCLPSESPVAYCGIAIRAGTRHESATQQGMAHFCEHLAFKGTRHHTARQIINAIEGIGGELNAFTNKEDTVFYCAIQKEYLNKAIGVLTDMVFDSRHPQAEVEKECEVVCDEIESYEDSPAELIYDDMENILFDGHPLGHNILGTKEQIRLYTAADTLAFTHQWYQPQNSVLFVSGGAFNQRKEECGETSGEGGRRNADCPPTPLAAPPAATIVRHRDTHQAHVMLGTRAYAANDPRRWALYLLSNMLGGPAMNSRLCLRLRERHGLVYTVESSMVCYSDAGLWTTYFGCDQHDVKRCLRMVRSELDKLMDKPLPEKQIAAAKRQLQGQLAIASDNREQFTLDFARTYLHTGRKRRLSDIMQNIDKLTAQDLLLTAQDVFAPEHITTLIYE